MTEKEKALEECLTSYKELTSKALTEYLENGDVFSFREAIGEVMVFLSNNGTSKATTELVIPIIIEKETLANITEGFCDFLQTIFSNKGDVSVSAKYTDDKKTAIFFCFNVLEDIEVKKYDPSNTEYLN
ncbi:MAG: hypothetical protein ISR98_00275 [Parcubacteria group bacterium]|nr:hypothetical protein [Parcubacteria group bacterium]